MYREKYAHKRAIQLFAAGRGPEVLPMLLEEGAAPDQAEHLALKYQKMQQLLATEDARKKRKGAQTLITIGLVFLAGGAFLSLLSWLYLGGSYVVYVGIMLFGGGLLLKGILEQQAATQLTQTPAE
ncbi:hypothetical protein [Hymenobacter sp. 102]|uniref:hypothetical protein n=1 Tax=Hymenobacter sp. 102 TaxID=3403152 RepID=UPI003CEE3BA5